MCTCSLTGDVDGSRQMKCVILWGEGGFALTAAIEFFWNAKVRPCWTGMDIWFHENFCGEWVELGCQGGVTGSCMSKVNRSFNSIFSCSHNLMSVFIRSGERYLLQFPSLSPSSNV